MKINLTGSPKQIAYATDILNRMEVGFNWMLNEAPDEKKEKYADIINTITNAPAGKVINCYRLFKSDAAVNHFGNIVCADVDAKRIVSRFYEYQRNFLPQDRF